MEYTCPYVSPLGTLCMKFDDEALTGLWFTGQKYAAQEYPLATRVPKGHSVATQVLQWLDCYFSGGRPDCIPPLMFQGTVFQRIVWQILLQIPYGSTTTYGDIAREIAHQRHARRMSAQAVGGAVGRNPIGIIVPCHRVIGSGGNLTGYAAGLDKKIQLLRLEQVDMSKLYRPTRGTAL